MDFFPLVKVPAHPAQEWADSFGMMLFIFCAHNPRGSGNKGSRSFRKITLFLTSNHPAEKVATPHRPPPLLVSSIVFVWFGFSGAMLIRDGLFDFECGVPPSSGIGSLGRA